MRSFTQALFLKVRPDGAYSLKSGDLGNPVDMLKMAGGIKMNANKSGGSGALQEARDLPDPHRSKPGSQSSPVPKEDRRWRSRSRAHYSDRRALPRYHSDFPAKIYLGQGAEEKVYEARVKDISSGGLLVEVPGMAVDEERVRVHFNIPDGVMPEEFLHGAVSATAKVRRRSEDHQVLGLAFDEDLQVRYERTVWGYLRWGAGLLLLAAACLVLLIKYDNFYNFWFDIPVFLYSLLVGAYLLSRFIFAAFYSDSKPLPELPSATVIVPVRNEEAHIGRTLRQAFESEYPRDRLQVIVVNDASTDRSLEVIQETRRKYPELVVVNLEKAAGKRHAMATGSALATGEVIVFMDSDSFLQPDALRHLMNRFADPGVAAVTGHCDVENIWANALTKMQAVRYFVAFRVMKAAESVFDVVTCLSGPLAAYRRDRLNEVMDEWLSQTFLGRPATYGDDRSLTNSLLRRGYKVVYEFKARVTTIVPERYQAFLNQQIRWKRSWFRESLIASTFMWRQQPLMALSFYLGFLLPILSPAIVIRALLYVPLAQQHLPLMYLGGVLLMSVLMSSVYLFYRRSRLWLYGVWFCLFYMFVLVWQMWWAILTSWRSDWVTRS